MSHPFELLIDKNNAKNISKIYNRSYKFLTVEQLLSIEKFFNLLANYTPDEETSEYLRGISILKRIDKTLLNDLIYACNNKHSIEFDYRAPNSGKIHYLAIPKEFYIRSKKLYINIYCENYEKNLYLPVKNIISPITINLSSSNKNKYKVWVKYELTGIAAKNFVEQSDEVLIETKEDRKIVKYTTDTYFQITQKVFSYGPNCKIIEPIFVRDFNVNKLIAMYEEYKNG